MLNEKRLAEVELSLTPKQAVRLWLRQEHQGKTMRDYVLSLVERPASASPRSRVARQVVAAIQAAMKGQDPVRIQQAARQALMETDFLIVLVNRTNSEVLDQRRDVWFRIALLLAVLTNTVFRDEDSSDELEAKLPEFAAELFALQLAVERIQARYFAGECILAKDVKESLDQSTMFLRYFLAALDAQLEEDGHPEVVIDSAEFRKVVDDKASRKVLYICDLAKSEMLQNFGRGDAANAVLRPFILGDQ
jgi:hypothetical protein